jgi:hypothetical protein
MTTWSYSSEGYKEYNNGNREVSVTLTSGNDASASDYDITTYARNIKGMFLYEVRLVPGTGGATPTGAYDLDIEDEDDTHILDTDANSNVANAAHQGSDTLHRDPMILDTVSIVCADLGDANTVMVRLFFSNIPLHEAT